MRKLALLTAFLAAGGFAARIPRSAPDIAIALPNGNQAKVSEYKGKVRCLIFFLTTCPHCQATIVTLNGVQKDFGPKGLQVLAGAINEDADIPQFIKRFQPAYPVGRVDLMAAGAFMQLPPNVRTFVPYLVFIDRAGMIRAQYTGGDAFLAEGATQEKNIREEVTKLLAGGKN